MAASRLTPTGAALPSVTRPSTHGVSVRFDRSELEKEDAEMFADNGDLIVGSRAPGAKRTKTAKELGTEALEEMARKRGVSTSVPVLSTLTAAKKSTEEAETAETNGEPLPQVCEICERDDVAVTLLLCDGCDKSFHMLCLTPPLTEVPRGQWFCGRCVSKNASVNDSKVPVTCTQRRHNSYLLTTRALHVLCADLFSWGRTLRRRAAYERDGFCVVGGQQLGVFGVGI